VSAQFVIESLDTYETLGPIGAKVWMRVDGYRWINLIQVDDQRFCHLGLIEWSVPGSNSPAALR
jgi:hypothetical protein